MIDVKVVKYCRLDLESWTDEGVGVVGEVVGGGRLILLGFLASLCSKGEKPMSSSATFPLFQRTLRHVNSFCKHASIDQNPVT